MDGDRRITLQDARGADNVGGEPPQPRADLIRQIVLKNDTVEIAARVSIVTKDAPETMLERVLSRYITDELVKREAQK